MSNSSFLYLVIVSTLLLSAVKFQAEIGLLSGSLLWFSCISALVFFPALAGVLKSSFVMGPKKRR